jgi:3-oxoacyl-[acyl-carrier protein] reductase
MTDLIKTVPKEKINKIISMMGIKRLAKYSDVSNVIDFYIKDESDYVSGQNIYLGGIS